MLTPPPPPKNQTQPPLSGGGSGALATGKKEPEIVVIPDKFYGMALKMKADAPVAAPPPVPTPSPKPSAPGPIKPKSRLPWIALVVVLLLLVTGGFAYFNRDLLFKKSAPPIVVVPSEPSAPSAPANLTATVASGTTAVALAWVDTTGNETGYRIERKEGEGTYLPLTNLSLNSGNFLDVTVVPERIYTYRVLAVGPGGESSSSNEARVTVGSIEPSPAPSPSLPPGGLDSDSDGLTDYEEPLYGTDVRVQDSDEDGFLDGNEVFHLYNPAATAPVRLLDSGLVKPIQASAGWSLYVPKDWTSSLTGPDGARATLRTGQGETFVLSIEDNPEDLELEAWHTVRFPGASSLRQIKTKGGLEGLFYQESLRAIFAWDGKVVVFTYELAGKPFINYRTTFEMMLNSLVLEGVPILSSSEISDLDGPGEILPTEATSTSATSTAP